MIQLVSDCEGPTCLNDNALELAEHFIPGGGELFFRLSRYDDYRAEIETRGWQPGGTLKLIIPFLLAHGASQDKVTLFCEQNVTLVNDISFAFGYLKGLEIPIFMVSTSYEPFALAVAEKLGLDSASVFSTPIDFDDWILEDGEAEQIKTWAKEINSQPPLEIEAKLPDAQRAAKKRLDDIFREMTSLSCGDVLKAVAPVGGVEKVRAAQQSLEKTGNSAQDIIFVGDSITDKPALEWTKSEGGLAVAFNGNKYAVAAADVACLSNSALILPLLVETRLKRDKEAVLSLADNWNLSKTSAAHGELRQRLQKLDKPNFPRLYKVTESNVARVSDDSERYRKIVRGDRIGVLG